MKKNILYPLFTLLLLGMTLTSCEDMFGDFLDKQPSNELTEEIVFSDWTTTRQFHFDTYNFLRHGAGRINGSWLDAATDLSVTSFSYGGTRVSFNIGNYYNGAASNELTGTWEHYYRGIRKCNFTLTKIDEVPKPADESDEKYETDKLNYKSEARFLRAWFYWEMFLRYGPLPIVTEVLDPDGDLLTGYTTRPSIKEYVVDFILSELKDCESGLMNYIADESELKRNAGRITKPIARALYSRIMLYMASDRFRAASGITWAEAVEASKGFIDTYGGLYALFQPESDPVANYTAAILRNAHSGKNRETIFWRNQVAVGWSAISDDTPVGEGGMGGNCPTQNLVDMYDMANGESPFASYDETGAPVYNEGLMPKINPESGYNEANFLANRDARLQATVLYQGVSWGNGVINVIRGQRDNPLGNTNATPTGYYMRKYIPENILSANHSGSNFRNWIIMRYAEILLNYAEALNEAGGSRAEVLNILQPIRDRAGLTAKLVERKDLQTLEDRRNFIRKERAVELAYEEHRIWDVRRWNVAEKALARPIYGVDVTNEGGVIKMTRKVAQERVFDSKMYLYPIPEAEEWKTNIENNPGW
ncbi:RagB/SusD family nutrient uptake outer membrane protein [Parabacteroides sp. OttesenSCG-928-J18]|nr:RagB/SusD family nutrient uptake outer membrane protein [Parabacteroides sp. OttesenSCG-928-J18]